MQYKEHSTDSSSMNSFCSWRLKLREVRMLPQGHRGFQSQPWDSNPVCPALKHWPFCSELALLPVQQLPSTSNSPLPCSLKCLPESTPLLSHFLVFIKRTLAPGQLEVRILTTLRHGWRHPRRPCQCPNGKCIQTCPSRWHHLRMSCQVGPEVDRLPSWTSGVGVLTHLVQVICRQDWSRGTKAPIFLERAGIRQELGPGPGDGGWG